MLPGLGDSGPTCEAQGWSPPSECGVWGLRRVRAAPVLSQGVSSYSSGAYEPLGPPFPHLSPRPAGCGPPPVTASWRGCPLRHDAGCGLGELVWTQEKQEPGWRGRGYYTHSPERGQRTAGFVGDAAQGRGDGCS